MITRELRPEGRFLKEPVVNLAWAQRIEASTVGLILD